MESTIQHTLFLDFQTYKTNISFQEKVSEMEYYKRKPPHWQISGAEYFVTFRLAGSLPIYIVKELQQLRRKLQRPPKENQKNNDTLKRKLESRLFKKYEELLDSGSTGPTWLKQPEIAEIIKDSLHYRDKKKYNLYAYCIMSNHVHLVFRHLTNEENKKGKDNLSAVTKILKNLKSFTGLQANRKLNREGAFWYEESYDRLIRNNRELDTIIRYTLNNPVKANLVENWKDWPYSYCKLEFIERL